MTSLSVAGTTVGAEGTSGTDAGQKTTEAEQEEFVLSADVYDRYANTQLLEVYQYWAAIERQREANDPRPIPDSPWTVAFKSFFGKRHEINHADQPASYIIEETSDNHEQSEKPTGEESPPDYPSSLTEEEKTRAYRALRVASWQVVFYLITTDILGFSSAEQAFVSLGYGPGVLTYCFFYFLAVFAGQVIWKLYLDMDSSKYPVTCYADLGERTFGRKVRHIFNVFQSLQLLFNVALLIIGNGQTLVVMINWKFCYLALNIFFTLVGMVGGQVRSLRNFSWFTNINIWLNIAVMVITVVGIELYAPIPSVSNHKSLNQPIMTSGWVPSYSPGWYQQVSGVQLAVFAYGGAMIFPEFMAEMRRPRDFWKSALCAQLFCFIMYMVFGLVTYAKQGQYGAILPNINFANQTLILVNNVIGLVTIMVAAVLYGNIGVKVFYENVLRAYFKAPSLVSTKGRWVWTVTVCTYWTVAWVIGSAVPNLTALVTLVGASCILQFTYTFPPILLLGWWVQCDAIKGDNPWVPGTKPGSNRIDTWRDKSRWVRGFRKYWYIKVFLLLWHLAAWANCALGIYAGIEVAKSAFTAGYNIPFSCISPNDPSVQPGN